MRKHLPLIPLQLWANNGRGQLFKFPVIVVAFFALLFVHILTYFLFSLSGVSDVAASRSDAGKLLAEAGNPFVGETLSAYLRTPLPSTLNNKGSGIDATLSRFLLDHPELWLEKTYGEFLSLLISAYPTDTATLSSVFSGVTHATFDALPPLGKRFTLTIGNSQTIIVDSGTIGALEQRLLDIRTAKEAFKFSDSIIEEIRTAKDYEEFKALHTSRHTIATLSPKPATISIYTLTAEQDLNPS